MAKIEFKAKIHTVPATDKKAGYTYLKVPVIKHCHCDMHAFRQHKKYGDYANSILFISMLARIRQDYFPSGIIKSYEIPKGVTVDTSEFLAKVSFDV